MVLDTRIALRSGLEQAINFFAYAGILYLIGLYAPVGWFFGDCLTAFCAAYFGARSSLSELRPSWLTVKLFGITMGILFVTAMIGVHLLQVPNIVFGKLFNLTLLFYFFFGIGRWQGRALST